jgi:hypothetical protein
MLSMETNVTVMAGRSPREAVAREAGASQTARG